MADVEKVARAICRAAGLDPDAVAMVEVKLGREPVRTLRWQVHIPQAEAALAAMGEREAVADDRLAPVREDVIRMRLEALFAGKPIEQWGPMSLATALSPNVEFLVAAAVSNERLRVASPRPEAVEEIAAIAESLRQAYPMEASRILILLGKAQPATIRATEGSKG